MDSEAGFTVLVDEKGSFESYSPSPQRFWISPASKTDFEKTCNDFGGCQPTWSKEFVEASHLCDGSSLWNLPTRMLKLLAWQVAADKGTVDVGKNYKYLFQYLPAEKEKDFSNLLDFSSLEKIIQSLFATMQLFHQEAQRLAQKLGSDYDKEVAEKMIEYAEERVKKFGNN